MADPVILRSSRTYPVPLEQAFDLVLPAALERFFTRRYGPIPPIKGVEGQQGLWGTVGQTRTVRLADGGSMREELVSVDRPNSFGYRLTDLTGPLKPLASSVEGLWSFAPAGSGVRISWQWTVHPVSRLGALALPVFGRFWHGYARQALEQLETLLLPA
ncbi:MAG: SRPBCC family protein [Jatrophihabitans sp.]